MKHLIIITIIFLITGCIQESTAPHKKPFVIVFKFPEAASCNSDFCRYQYIDANNNAYYFCESETKYSIGDTIK